MGYIKPDLLTVLAVLPMFQATVFSGQVEDANVLDIADFFFFNFYRSGNIENLDFKNPRLSNIRVFNIDLY